MAPSAPVSEAGARLCIRNSNANGPFGTFWSGCRWRAGILTPTSKNQMPANAAFVDNTWFKKGLTVSSDNVATNVALRNGVDRLTPTAAARRLRYCQKLVVSDVPA